MVEESKGADMWGIWTPLGPPTYHKVWAPNSLTYPHYTPNMFQNLGMGPSTPVVGFETQKGVNLSLGGPGGELGGNQID